MALHVLTDADKTLLKTLFEDVDRLKQKGLITGPSDVPNQASDIFIIGIPTGGIPPTFLNQTSAEFETNPRVCNVYKIDPAINQINQVIGLTILVHNLGDSLIDSFFAIAKKTKFGRWVLADEFGGEGTGTGTGTGTETCNDLIDPDDCWLGCRQVISGTGGGSPGIPGTIFHKQPWEEILEADCVQVYAMNCDNEGTTDICYIKFDDGGHLIGVHLYNAGWASPWFGDEEPFETGVFPPF